MRARSWLFSSLFLGFVLAFIAACVPGRSQAMRQPATEPANLVILPVVPIEPAPPVTATLPVTDTISLPVVPHDSGPADEAPEAAATMPVERAAPAAPQLVTATLTITPEDEPWVLMVGQPQTFTLALLGTGTFSGPVDLALGGLPAGFNVQLEPNPAPPTGTVALGLAVEPGTLGDTYDFAITGTAETVSGTVTHPVSATAALQVEVQYGLYLPYLPDQYPPIPYAPRLDPITGVDDGTFTVSWVEEPERLADTYTLQEARDIDFTVEVRTVCTTAQQQCTIANQPAGVYYYRVRGENELGIGPWSKVNWTFVPPPETPTLFAIANADGDGSYIVSWSSAARATSYRLEESQDPNFPAPSVIYNGPATSFVVNGRPAGTFYYRVRAEGPTGPSPYSNVQPVTVLPPDTPILNPIDNADRDGNYTVSWTATARATGYTLQEATNASFSNAVTVFSGPQTSWPATNKAGGTYYYRVRAEGPTGISGWSNVQSTSVVPPPPNLLPISNPNSNSTYYINWTSVSGALRYQLQEDDSLSFSSPVTLYEGPGTTFRAMYRPAGTNFYRVRAILENNVSTDWSEARFTSVASTVHISSSSAVAPFVGSSSMSIVGEVHNLAGFRVGSIQIRANLRNSSGGLIATASTTPYITVLSNNMLAPFVLQFNNVSGWSSYELFVTFSGTSASVNILDVLSESQFFDAANNFIVSGTIRNPFNFTATFARAVVTVYDSDNNVIGAALAFTVPPDILPGQTAIYDVVVDNYVGKPDRTFIRSYRLAAVDD